MDTILAARVWCAAHLRRRGERGERGDVPGWVLITVMSVALVTALLAFARPALVGMLRSALSSVQ